MTRRTRFLVNEHPAIAAQWHSELNADLDLGKIGPGSHKAVFWRCDDGHVWQADRGRRPPAICERSHIPLAGRAPC